MDPDRMDDLLGPRLHWSPVPYPDHIPLTGRHVTLEPMNADRHASALFRASHGAGTDPNLWDYLSAGPWEDEASFRTLIEQNSASPDALYYSVVPTGGEASGQASYMRIEPRYGVIEIGHIWFAAAIQRSRASTEAIYLLARHVFDDLGYRRLEWKCNDRNERSRRAAERFGFTYEGTFRNAIVVRDRNRDTAWYSVIDTEWPAIRAAFETWLADNNFDADGRQVRTLAEIRGMG